MALVMCVGFAPACVIPPSLVEAPPSPNYPPAILRDDLEFPVVPPPGVIEHMRGIAVPPLQLDSIPVVDPNVGDVLTLRLLLDGIVMTTLEPLLTGAELREFRNVDVDPQPCDFIDEFGQLVGIVSDRGFTGAGREVPAEAGTSSVEWVIHCF